MLPPAQSAMQAELPVSVVSLGLINGPLEEHVDIATATTATICVSLLITLFCFWTPHAVDALLLPVEIFQHVQLRNRDERVAGATFIYLLVIPVLLMYQLSSGMLFNAAVAATFLAYVVTYWPSYEGLCQIFNFWVFAFLPFCLFLASKGVIEWNGLANCFIVPTFGAILHDLPSQQLRAAIFVNAIHLFTGDISLTPGCVFGTFLSTFAVMIKGSLHPSLSRWMSDSQFVACLSTVVLVSLALCRLQDAYPSQIYSVLQEHASVATAFASSIALLLALVCYVQEQAVDTVLLPLYGAEILKDRLEILLCHHEREAEIIRFYGFLLFGVSLAYQLSYGMWLFTSMSICTMTWLTSRPTYTRIREAYYAWVFLGTPVCIFLVSQGVLVGRGWANCFIIPTLGAILHDLPSQQLSATFYFIALLVLKGDTAQVVGSVVLGLVSTVLSIRAKTTLLQHELYDKLVQAKLKEVFWHVW